MNLNPGRFALRAGGVCAVLLLGLAPLLGCGFSLGSEAKNQWTRSYPLAAGGTLAIKSLNGNIDVQTGDGTTVEVVAERVVRAASDEAAKAALAELEITESVSADRIALGSASKSEGGGWFEHVSRTINYTVKLPKGAKVSLDTTNGNIEVRGVTGGFRAGSTNGNIKAAGLECAAEAQSTNGDISLDFAKVVDAIKGDTTNGSLEVTVPKDVNANLTARVTNGSIDTSGLNIATTEDSGRRLEAKLGTGGPTIRLGTTNGSIGVKGR